MCPVCTVTVVAGLGISRLLGIDDIVTSVWIGGFILSFSFATINWIDKKWPKLSVTSYQLLVIILIYALVLVPLYLNHSVGVPGNTLWGVDKILFGTAIGSIVFLIGVGADKFQREKFKKTFFPFQKVVFPVAALIIAGAIFYLLTK